MHIQFSGSMQALGLLRAHGAALASPLEGVHQASALCCGPGQCSIGRTAGRWLWDVATVSSRWCSKTYTLPLRKNSSRKPDAMTENVWHSKAKRSTQRRRPW